MKEKIHEWVTAQREALIRDLGALVRIPSVSEDGDEKAPYGESCLKALHTFLRMSEDYGFTTSEWENQIGCIEGCGAGEEIALWGHLDVVAAGGNWDYAPFEPTLKEGVLIGRGAQDNKGQALACLYVMRCLKELGISLRHTVKLYVGTDEERGMGDLKKYAACHALPAFSIVADSNFPVCYGEKGIITFRLEAPWPGDGAVLSAEAGVAANVVPDYATARLRTVDGGERALVCRGISGHTAFPEHCQNAILELTRELCEEKTVTGPEKRILQFFTRVNADCYGEALGLGYEDEDSGKMTLVGSMLKIENGRAALTCNIRTPLTQNMDELLQSLERIARENGCQCAVEQASAPHRFPREHHVVERLNNVYEEITGKKRDPFVLPGGTYSRLLPSSISFGMGYGADQDEWMQPYKHLFRPGHGGAHGPDECTVIDMLLQAIEIYVLGLTAIDDIHFAKQEEENRG